MCEGIWIGRKEWDLLIVRMLDRKCLIRFVVNILLMTRRWRKGKRLIFESHRLTWIWSKNKNVETEIRVEGEGVRVRVRVISSSIYFYFSPFYLLTYVLFLFSIFFIFDIFPFDIFPFDIFTFGVIQVNRITIHNKYKHIKSTWLLLFITFCSQYM